MLCSLSFVAFAFFEEIDGDFVSNFVFVIGVFSMVGLVLVDFLR